MVKRLSWYLHFHTVATELSSSWLSMTLFYHWGARRLGWQPRRLEGVEGVPKHGRVFRGSSAGTTGALENQEGKAPLGTNTNPSKLAKIDSVRGWQQHEVPTVVVRRGEYSWTGIFLFQRVGISHNYTLHVHGALICTEYSESHYWIWCSQQPCDEGRRDISVILILPVMPLRCWDMKELLTFTHWAGT